MQNQSLFVASVQAMAQERLSSSLNPMPVTVSVCREYYYYQINKDTLFLTVSVCREQRWRKTNAHKVRMYSREEQTAPGEMSGSEYIVTLTHPEKGLKYLFLSSYLLKLGRIPL